MRLRFPASAHHPRRRRHRHRHHTPPTLRAGFTLIKADRRTDSSSVSFSIFSFIAAKLPKSLSPPPLSFSARALSLTHSPAPPPKAGLSLPSVPTRPSVRRIEVAPVALLFPPTRRYQCSTDRRCRRRVHSGCSQTQGRHHVRVAALVAKRQQPGKLSPPQAPLWHWL